MADHKTDKLEAAELKTNSGKNAPAKEKKPGFFKRIGARFKKWFKELKSEAKKVSWPTFKQVVNNSLVVLAVVVMPKNRFAKGIKTTENILLIVNAAVCRTIPAPTETRSSFNELKRRKCATMA